jgi:LysM repeat protein
MYLEYKPQVLQLASANQEDKSKEQETTEEDDITEKVEEEKEVQPFFEYVVQPGDTLIGISMKYDVPVCRRYNMEISCNFVADDL